MYYLCGKHIWHGLDVNDHLALVAQPQRDDQSVILKLTRSCVDVTGSRKTLTLLTPA